MIADNPRTSESSHSSTNYLKSKNEVVEMSPILRKIIYKSEINVEFFIFIFIRNKRRRY